MPRDPQLDKLINDLKAKQYRDGEGKRLMDTVGEKLKTEFGPAIKDAIKEGLSAIKMPEMPKMPEIPQAQTPEIPAPVVNIPAPVVNVPAPVVNIPAPVVNIPKTEIPAYPDFPSEIGLKGVNPKNPLPVQMVDMAGKPFFPGANSVSTGGRGDFFTLKDIQTSAGASIIDQTEGAMKVTGTVSVGSFNSSTQSIDSSGNPYSQANPLPVVFSSSGSTASALIDSSGVQYSGSNPLPVVFGASATQGVNVVDSSGVAYSGTNPVPVGGTLTAVTSITNSIAATILDESGSPWQPFTYAQGDVATAQRVVIAGNSDASVVVNSGTLTAVTSITNSVASALVDSSGVQYSGTNPVPVTGTVTVGSITNSIAATLLDESGSPWQPFVYNQGDVATAQRVVIAGNSDASVVVNSGTITAVTNITNSIAAVILDRDGTPQSSGPIAQGDAASAFRVVVAGNSDASVVVNSGTLTAVTSITNSVAAAVVDSGGVQYSTSNPFPINEVGGGPDSMFVYQARTTLPTAVSDGADVRPKADKLGRPLTRPINARDLIRTAHVTLSTGTEATLLAASAGNFLDLISIIAANTSTAAQQLDIRATTAGNIVQTLYIPAQATAGWTPPVPWPQDNQGNNWTVDMADVTNSNIIISALFSKES